MLLTVALDSAASCESRNRIFGAVCLTVSLGLNRLANEGESFRLLLVSKPEEAEARMAFVITGARCYCKLAGEANL